MATARKIYEGLKKHDGSINELATRCKCSREWVRQVLTGRQEDGAVLLKGAQLWKELEMNQRKLKSEVERLTSEAEELSAQNLQLA